MRQSLVSALWLLSIVTTAYLAPRISIVQVGDARVAVTRFVIEAAVGTDRRIQKLEPVTSLVVSPNGVQFRTLTNNQIADRIFEFAPEFERLTGVEVFETYFRDSKDVGLTIYILDDPSSTCQARLPDPETGRHAVIYLQEDDPNTILNVCLLHEMAHAFGLQHSCGQTISIMCQRYTDFLWNNNIPNEHFTEADRIALQVLYDPRLKRGMSSAEATPIARAILQEIWTTELDRAFAEEDRAFLRLYSKHNRGRCARIRGIRMCFSPEKDPPI